MWDAEGSGATRNGRAGSRLLVLLFFKWSLKVRMDAIVVVFRQGVCVVAVVARDREPLVTKSSSDCVVAGYLTAVNLILSF